MKRILPIVLLIALCFTLCACSGVKQEVYDAAMSSYEAAKAGYDELSAKYDVLKSKVEKYATVIDALEKEDYDGAVEAVNAMRPAPEVTEVEITMDNLWDYFEITEDRREQNDAQGNLYGLSIIYDLSLKEEYALAEGDEYPTDISVGYEYDDSIKVYFLPCTIDFESFTCDKSAYNRWSNHESKMAQITNRGKTLYSIYVYCPVDQSSNQAAQIEEVENFEILNASGTLYLVNK